VARVERLREVLVHPLVEVAMTYMVVISVAIAVIDYSMGIPERLREDVYLVDGAIVSILALDFIVRALLSGQPLKYVARNAYEIPALIPLYLLALVEGIPSIAGLVRLLRLLRLARLVLLATRGPTFLRALLESARRLQLITIIGLLALTVVTSAFLAYIVESPSSSSNIKSMWDALWWALATVTTVGYGDVVPETQAGRVIGAITMVVGIGAYSAFVGMLAATITQVAQTRREPIDMIRSRLEKLEELDEEELEELLDEIKRMWKSKKAERASRKHV